MIIRFPNRGAKPTEEQAAESRPPALCSECGRRARLADANYCGRCGRRIAGRQAGPVRPRTVAEPVVEPTQATGALLRWERMPRPRSTAALARAKRRDLARPRRLPAPSDELSARQTFSRAQVVALRVLGAAVFLGAAVNLLGVSVAVVAVITSLYVGVLVYRVRTFSQALREDPSIVISDAEARRIWDRTLPTYTVLVPAFREPEMMARIIGELDRLDYPRDRLDIKLLLEEDDAETIAAARTAVTGPHFQIVAVPFSLPRTKPKALNYGLSLVRGRKQRGLVTIYDVEDRPDPLQLRRAVAAFRRLPPSVACLQARLGYYNADQNIITRWFTVEYAMWFSQLLPGLLRQSAPIPLGGTSNHFRRAALEAVGAWDAHNVTEDADLGIRLHRSGYRTGVLASTTLEEANSDFVNWIKQRSRWYKGYMQTWLVHMRHPRQLRRELGTWGFIGFNLFVGGTPFLALVNPVFWALTVAWFTGRPEFITSLFPSWLYYVSLCSMVFGNAAFAYTAMVSARATGRPQLVLAAALSPLYWVMMSIAAIKAALQLGPAPSFWEKTFHGLDRAHEEEAAERAAA